MPIPTLEVNSIEGNTKVAPDRPVQVRKSVTGNTVQIKNNHSATINLVLPPGVFTQNSASLQVQPGATVPLELSAFNKKSASIARHSLRPLPTKSTRHTRKRSPSGTPTRRTRKAITRTSMLSADSVSSAIAGRVAVLPLALCLLSSAASAVSVTINGLPERVGAKLLISGNWSPDVDFGDLDVIEATKNGDCNSVLINLRTEKAVSLPIKLRPRGDCAEHVIAFTGRGRRDHGSIAAVQQSEFRRSCADDNNICWELDFAAQLPQEKFKIWVLSCRNDLGEPCITESDFVLNTVVSDVEYDWFRFQQIYSRLPPRAPQGARSPLSDYSNTPYAKVRYPEPENCSTFWNALNDIKGNHQQDEFPFHEGKVNIYYLDRWPDPKKETIEDRHVAESPRGETYLAPGVRNGIACESPPRDMILIAAGNPPETLAHEYGHLLGLDDLLEDFPEDQAQAERLPNNLMRKGVMPKCALNIAQVYPLAAHYFGLPTDKSYCDQYGKGFLSAKTCSEPVGEDFDCVRQGRPELINFVRCLHCSSDADYILETIGADLPQSPATELARIGMGQMRLSDRLRLRDSAMGAAHALAIDSDMRTGISRGIEKRDLRRTEERATRVIGQLLIGQRGQATRTAKNLACQLRAIAAESWHIGTIDQSCAELENVLRQEPNTPLARFIGSSEFIDGGLLPRDKESVCPVYSRLSVPNRRAACPELREASLAGQ
jgi:hypothetical protein